MYKLIRYILFQLDAEQAHYVTLSLLTTLLKIPFIKPFLTWYFNKDNKSAEIFGLKFQNRVGLAAGFDKNAKYIDALAVFGFGHIEIGTVTPKGQEGNPKPRLFRLVKDEAIINRMGFNNDGVDAVIENLKKVKNRKVIIGGNIGKNKNTENEKAIEDYKFCFEKLYPYVHYFVINVSSPNTPGLRELQEKKPLTEIINSLDQIRKSQSTYKPLLLKIAPDLSNTQLDDICDIATETTLDGLVINNTTISRENLLTNNTSLAKIGAGGLSGKPLKKRADEVLNFISTKVNKPIIGVGGIHNENDANDKISAGASLLQLYTGFIYEGPGLVKKINSLLP